MKRAASVCPEEVRDEVLLPQRGDVRYWLCLGDEDVEILATGVCSEAVARQAYSMLSWKRLNSRRIAYDKNTHEEERR